MTNTPTPPPEPPPNFGLLKNPSVNIQHLDPALLKLLHLASQIHASLFQKPLVITSGNDGNHVLGSAHYQNRAFDLRTKDKTEAQQQLFLSILNYLAATRGAGVFDERQSKRAPHFHLELFA